MAFSLNKFQLDDILYLQHIMFMLTSKETVALICLNMLAKLKEGKWGERAKGECCGILNTDLFLWNKTHFLSQATCLSVSSSHLHLPHEDMCKYRRHSICTPYAWRSGCWSRKTHTKINLLALNMTQHFIFSLPWPVLVPFKFCQYKLTSSPLAI